MPDDRLRLALGGCVQVVVTGLGTFTSLGHDADEFFNNLLEGKCGIDRVQRFDEELSAVKIASEVKDFDVSKYWAPKDAKRCVATACACACAASPTNSSAHPAA